MNDYVPYISPSINNTLKAVSLFWPELILVFGFIAVIIAELLLSQKWSKAVFFVTLLTLCSSLGASVLTEGSRPAPLFGGMIVLDHLSIVFKVIFCLISLIFVAFVYYHKPLRNSAKGVGDLFSILLAIQLGLNLMVMSQNLLMVFLSLEMVSVGSYLMVGYLCNTPKQSEAAMKYAIFGAACSAFMLYGMSLLYGFTGSLDMQSPQFVAITGTVPVISWSLGIIMLLMGIAFKLSIVPFHFWAPDVYEGAPTPVTAFLSTAPKIAGFALLIRVLTPFQPLNMSGVNSPEFSLTLIMIVLAIMSMMVGNFGAIWQNNVKRMLAYSSIGHTGFMLMAVFIFSASGFKALLFYMVIYSIMNMAAFIIVDEVEEHTGKINADQYKGLGKSHGILMVALVIVLVSLTGLPPTAGFTAKFLVFSAAFEAYQQSGSEAILLMIATAAITTVVSLFYYFKIPLNAFLRSGDHDVPVFKPTQKTAISLVLVFLLLLFMLFPAAIQYYL